MIFLVWFFFLESPFSSALSSQCLNLAPFTIFVLGLPRRRVSILSSFSLPMPCLPSLSFSCCPCCLSQACRLLAAHAVSPKPVLLAAHAVSPKPVVFLLPMLSLPSLSSSCCPCRLCQACRPSCCPCRVSPNPVVFLLPMSSLPSLSSFLIFV